MKPQLLIFDQEKILKLQTRFKKENKNLSEKERISFSLDHLQFMSWLYVWMAKGTMRPKDYLRKRYFYLQKGRVVEQLPFFVKDKDKVWRMITNLERAGLMERYHQDRGTAQFLYIRFTDDFFKLLGEITGHDLRSPPEPKQKKTKEDVAREKLLDDFIRQDMEDDDFPVDESHYWEV